MDENLKLRLTELLMESYDKGIEDCRRACEESLQCAIKNGLARQRQAIAQLVEQMGIEGYGTLAIAAAIRQGDPHEQ